MLSEDACSTQDSNSNVFVNSLSYREMQKLCKERGLAANGPKEVIRNRLIEDMSSSTNISSAKIENNVTSDPNSNIDFSDFAHNPGLQTPARRNKSTSKLSSTSEGNQRNKGSLSPARSMVPITPLSKLNNKEENPTTPTKSANKSEDNEKITTPSSRKKKSPKTSSSSRKRQRIIPGSLDPPKNWEKIYSIVEELRADKTAPLDTDGGEALPERHLGEKVYRFQVLVALMLSSQTKDAVVGDAMRAMQKHGLTVENIHATDALVLNGLINKVGFHNNKTKYLKQVAEILINEYDCDIPPTADEMIKSLSGVGPKMAYIVENVAFGISTGIGVDTHMHRIFNDIKWVNSKTPEQTREQLEGWLPKERWIEVNMLWVGFGQESQQQKEKILKKALKSSRPIEALNLLKKVGLNVAKEGKKYGLEDDIKNAYNAISNKE
jgi:endonuclease-3